MHENEGKLSTKFFKNNYWGHGKKRSCGFRRIFTVAFDWLFLVNFNDCLQSWEISPKGLEQP